MTATEDYMTGQLRPTHPALLAGYAAASDAVKLTAADVRYGPHPRQVFDFIRSPTSWRGTLAYFHAGFWQARDKAQFRCIATGLLPHGIDVAMVNYPLCPDVSLPDLMMAVRASVPAILAQAASLDRGGAKLIAAGHSAGGHLAVELALTDWGGTSPVGSVVGLSGVYDLAPLRDTPLNDKLLLDAAAAHAMSPVNRVRHAGLPAIFAVGGLETAAFRQQTVAMHAAWVAAGNVAECLIVDGADHFSLLDEWQRPGALLTAAVTLAGR